MSIFQDDALTQGQRLVWFAVRELATDGVCRVGPSGIADHMDSARAHVSRCVSTLCGRGWLKKTDARALVVVEKPDRPPTEAGETREPQSRNRDSQSTKRDSQSRDSQSRKGFPPFPFPFPQERISFNPHTRTPSPLPKRVSAAEAPLPSSLCRALGKISWEAEPLPNDHPALWDHHPGQWTFDFAAAAMTHFDELDLLATPTEKKIDREGEDRVIAQWADTFRLLHEQDGYSRQEIRETMEWLFDGTNFWIEKQAIRSVPPLRSRTTNGDAYKFDVMHQQAHSNGLHSDKDAKQRPKENWQRLARAAAGA